MSDNIIINTTTENINLSVSTTTDVYSLSVINVDGASRWGLIVGTLSAQTDLWNVLSAKAFTVDLLSLSSDVIAIETFLNLLSGTWNGGFDAFTTVSTNSANWNTAYNISTIFANLSSRYNSTSTVVESNSAKWNSAYSSTTALNLSSNFWNSTYTTVQSNSATTWNYQGTDLKALSGNWQSAYVTVNTLSANWQGAHTWVRTNSANATFQTISAIALSGVFYGDGSNLIGASLPGQANINTIVQSNSANWNTAYNTALTYQSVSSNYATTTLLQSTSALLTPLTVTNTLTGQLVTNSAFSSYQTNVANTTATLLPTSIYQNTSGFFATNTLLQSTSALLTPLTVTNTLTSQLVLNTTLNQLSGKWQDTYTNVISNSANWNTAYNTALTYQSVSSSYVTNTLLQSTSALLTPLTVTNTLTSQLVKTTDLNTLSATLLTRTDYRSSSATLLPITVYQTTSGSFATNTLLQSTSALLTPLTVTNTLTSQLVLNSTFSNYQTSVAASTATLLPTSIYQSASGNWQGTFTTVQSNSANWSTGFNYSTVYSQNSASYATYNYVNNGFLPLSGGTISGATRINNDLTVFGNLTATGTTTFANTIFSVTSSLSVVHIGTGPALYVGNNGAGDIASFYDIDQNVEVLHVGGINSSFPNVGVKTSTPNVDFTVNGQISSNNIIWDANGNSNNWNSAFNISTAYQNTSGSFATNTLLQSTSSLLTPLTVTNNLTSQLVKTVDLQSLSATLLTRTDFNTASSTLVLNSTLRSLSSNWQDSYNTVNSLSANWNSAFNTATTYQNASGSFATNTALNAASALLTPLTLTNTLTSQLVLNTTFSDYQTNVANATATLLPTTTYQNTSGSFATISFTDSKYLPLSGGTITGSISSNDSFTTTGTIEAAILRISSAPATFINPLTASNSFLVVNVNGVDKALQLWDFTS